jgi:transcriptional regulator with XRE-family HTH domain
MTQASKQTTILVKLRAAKGKTQSEVARALDISERVYVRWEHGDTLPSAKNLIKLADFFGVHPRVLAA